MKVPFNNFQISKENNEILCNNHQYSNINNNKYIKEFEKNFANYINTKYCVQINSGINVLKTALEALKIKKNEEILIQGNMSPADLTYLIKLDYKFKCLDIDSDTLLVDATKIEENIEKDTKVIIVSHAYGYCADMDNIMEIAKKHNLYVIEEVTNAIGSLYKKKKLGSIGDIGCFSFNAKSNLKVLGNCGALTINNEKIYNDVINIDGIMKNNGQNECYTKYISPNSLDHMQAHMLNNNLTVLDNQNKMRRKIREQYKKCLSGSKDILIPEQKSLCDSCSNLFIIKVMSKQTRDKLREYLNHYSIDTKIHINIEHDRQRDTQQIKHKVKLVNMQNTLDCVLYLPMYPELSEDKIKFISLKLKKYFHRGNLMRTLYKKVVNDLSADKTKTYKFASINKVGFMTWFKDDRTTKQERVTARALIKSKRITF